MTGVVIFFIFMVLLGPAALLWGVDSRPTDERDTRSWAVGGQPRT